MTAFFIILLVVAIYLAPTATAYRRKVARRQQVLVLNLLLGWTFIFWIVALVMAYSPNVEAK